VLSPETKGLGGNTAIVPFPIAQGVMAPPASPRAPQLLARVARVEAVDSVKAEVERWAAARLGSSWKDEASVGAGAPQLRLDQARQGILIFKMVMGTFAGISLIVGGIGIMNVLLAAVTERTREIGIRKAIGARQRDILLQFLSESVAISGIGSILGVALGLAGAFGATAVIRSASEAQLHAAFTWGTVAVAALVSVLVGLAFGTYPALRAARLSPIEAIRHE
jgi:putative ABC transport system permease protein